MRILGIDPGTATTGYGIIESPPFPSSPGARLAEDGESRREGRMPGGQERSLRALAYGCIRTPVKAPLEKRLSEIYDDLNKLIKKYKPNLVAVESLFFFKNIATAISVSHARGVVLLAAHEHKLKVVEFTPLQVKNSLTGFGRAEKKQVQYMVRTLLNLKSVPKPDDAADALAIALCGAGSKL